MVNWYVWCKSGNSSKSALLDLYADTLDNIIKYGKFRVHESSGF